MNTNHYQILQIREVVQGNTFFARIVAAISGSANSVLLLVLELSLLLIVRLLLLMVLGSHVYFVSNVHNFQHVNHSNIIGQ